MDSKYCRIFIADVIGSAFNSGRFLWKIYPTDDRDDFNYGSSDAGDVSYECPTVQLAAGMGPNGTGKSYAPHTIEFTQMTCSEQAMENCMAYVKGFALTAAQLLSNPAHMEAIRAEFDQMEKI